MADLRPDRLAAELRDLLAELDDLHNTLGNIALEAMFAAEDGIEKARACKALRAAFFGIDDQRGILDRATTQLRALVVRLECPPERIAERLEGRGA